MEEKIVWSQGNDEMQENKGVASQNSDLDLNNKRRINEFTRYDWLENSKTLQLAKELHVQRLYAIITKQDKEKISRIMEVPKRLK